MRVPLVGGAYQARNLIASAQRCINLYPEINPEDSQAPVPVTHYPTPGLTLKASSPNIEKVRQVYRTTTGVGYCVVGPQVYFIDAIWNFTLIGSIPDAATPVYFSDNGLAVVLVDGSATGYAIDLATNRFGTIADPSFQGAIKGDYIDTFFVFNVPGTFKFYLSLSEVTFALLRQTAIGTGTISAAGAGYTNGTYQNVALTGGSGTGATATIVVTGNAVTGVSIGAQGDGYVIGDILSAAVPGGTGFTWTVSTMALAFDPLAVASKSGSADPIANIAVCHREFWPIGTLTSEAWIDVGAADFPLQALPGAFVEHGCAAPYSVATHDNSVYWLHQDRQGQAQVVKTQNYQAMRISTHAIEAEFQSYSTISDAIGYTFQIDGHTFYILTFPSADKTWGVDLQTGQWFEWASIDQNGILHRHRSNCYAFLYGLNVVGDWQNGRIYVLDSNAFTDNGVPIPRIRTFPHLLEDGKRVTYTQFIADIQVGTLPGVLSEDKATETDFNADFNNDFGGLGSDAANVPQVSLRWSDDRGQTFGNAVKQSMGAGGEYLTQPSWWRLGMARDRVFELSWSVPTNTALNGAFVDMKVHKT